MPEAPVITSADVASSEHSDEGSTSEGSSTEPGDKPGAPELFHLAAPFERARGVDLASQGAMLLSQLRRR